MLAGPAQHTRSGVLEAWQHHVMCTIRCRAGFRGDPYLQTAGCYQLSLLFACSEYGSYATSSHSVEGVGMGICWAIRLGLFCRKQGVDGHHFWNCLFPPSFICGSSSFLVFFDRNREEEGREGRRVEGRGTEWAALSFFFLNGWLPG